MKRSNAVRMSLALVLLVTLPIFLAGCEGLQMIKAGFAKIGEGFQEIGKGLSEAFKDFGKDTKKSDVSETNTQNQNQASKETPLDKTSNESSSMIAAPAGLPNMELPPSQTSVSANSQDGYNRDMAILNKASSDILSAQSTTINDEIALEEKLKAGTITPEEKNRLATIPQLKEQQKVKYQEIANKMQLRYNQYKGK
ncbi:MAG: hypothetical protein WA705_05470 [Candidatus Ozemobacteraceae bacterium]